MSILEVEGLSKIYRATRRTSRRRPAEVVAVADVSFSLTRGETFGLVGESGSGKSTTARCILRLTEPTSGTVAFDGRDLAECSTSEMRALRQRMQLVYQNPFSSLDPRMSIRSIVEEPLAIHRKGARDERRRRVDSLLATVGIDPADADRKPHAFSGGQRQRVALARALATSPDLILLDEPVSALDVSIQAQVLNLLRELQTSLRLTYVFIVHDLAVAEYFCDRVGVMYQGRIVELAASEELFRRPLHPYTATLLSAIPAPTAEHRTRRPAQILPVEEVSGAPAQGCAFRPRCAVGRTMTECAEVRPAPRWTTAGHQVACHFPGEMAVEGEVVGTPTPATLEPSDPT